MSRVRQFLLSLLITASLLEIGNGDAHIFTLHRIVENPSHPEEITPAQLEQLLSYCRDNNYTLVTVPELIYRLREGKSVDRWVAFTFDDGYQSVYTKALPIFKKYHGRFTLFLYLEGVKNHYTPYLNWGQIRELQREGVAIGIHSYRHFPIPLMDEKGIVADTLRAKKVLGAHLPQFFQIYAYPYDLSNLRTDQILKNYFVAILNGNYTPVNRYTSLSSLGRYECVGNLRRFKWILAERYLPVTLSRWETPDRRVWLVGKIEGEFRPPYVQCRIQKGIQEPIILLKKRVKVNRNGEFWIHFPRKLKGLIVVIKYRNYIWRANF
ncbi:MAG: polysaccharide deacetylase family protein [Campylobacterales bacterium]